MESSVTKQQKKQPTFSIHAKHCWRRETYMHALCLVNRFLCLCTNPGGHRRKVGSGKSTPLKYKLMVRRAQNIVELNLGTEESKAIVATT
jgi:hypothetical protein